MLDRPDDRILTDWVPQNEELFGKHNLKLQHNLHLSALFSDDNLARLLEKVEREDYHVNLMDNGVRREGEIGDASGKDVLDAVRKGDIWVNLRAPAKADSAYGDLLEDIYAEFESKVPGLETYKHELTILISSPNVRVKYHFDVPGQTLWQIRGRKKVFVYPNSAPFLPQTWLEKVILNEAHETDLRFKDWFDEHAVVYDLEPGELLHWPHNCPHRVDNYDCLNVSVTTEHWTNTLRNSYAVNYANGLLRKGGFKTLASPKSGLGMLGRLGLAGAVKASGIRNKKSKPYHVDFAVDPHGNRGVKEITPYQFQH